MTEVITSVDAWKEKRQGIEREGLTVGFVPTMGALHAGHESLLSRSAAECGVSVASIFVNPAQFDDAADLAAYPQALEADLAACERSGTRYLFLPDAETIYPDRYRYRVTETKLSRRLEGALRPGHFDGVLTVVLRLLQIVRPHCAYFGEKDWQQASLVRGMAEAFFLNIEIVVCPTVRDRDGVALSSRNVRLSPGGRALAAAFAARLKRGGPPEDIRRDLEGLGIVVQYIEEQDGRRLGAVMIDGVRLIDNVAL